jgi:hypothetical protein
MAISVDDIRGAPSTALCTSISMLIDKPHGHEHYIIILISWYLTVTTLDMGGNTQSPTIRLDILPSLSVDNKQ